ncbi:MAG: chromosome segregation protein SMC [Granulosicoccaceae bacterium]|jgi:chromosome segregation protein
MRLEKIKLAGFKSFVDPTTVSFPTNLSGIVGPNGCGKSNVIDAVRWVMGEISAKHLRGESMADVIFNGSSSRKPIGQAGIELVFDNSDGRAGGQYANFTEISVKRTVSRDGTSSYFLNGTRCRRRDIMDLFLGTGLGPRSYAIIEQGMISRFIEAKPDDMRVFIEEAAGISKYKERRRETENRIKHTRENLERVNDLREELDKQLQHLQRQAKTAEKYKVLKQEERQARAELLALRRRALDEEAQTRKKKIDETETAFEVAVANLREIESRLETRRAEHNEANDNFSRIQADFYKLGGEVSRIEQAIAHAKEKRQQLQQDQAAVNSSLAEAGDTLELDKQRITELDTSLQDIEPAWQSAKQAEAASAEALRKAESAMQDWQVDWEEFNRDAAEPGKAMQVEETRIQHLDQHLEQLGQRSSRMREELEGLDASALETEVSEMRNELGSAEQIVTQQSASLQDCQQRIGQCREDNANISRELDEARSTLQSQQGRLSSLEALQEAALGKHEEGVSEWLADRGLDKALRLAETLEVEPDWQQAVEIVLGSHLQAVGVEDAGSLSNAFDSLEQGALTLFENRSSQPASTQNLADSLVDKVRSEWPLQSLLGSVYAVNSIDEAFAMRDRLQAHESIITRDGIWLGCNWIRLSRAANEQAGVLQREQEIRETGARIAALETTVAELAAKQEQLRQDLHEHEAERERLQHSLDEAKHRQAEIRSTLGSRETALEQMRGRITTLNHELEELCGQEDTDRSELVSARERFEQAKAQAASLAETREQLVTRRDNLREALDQARDRARADHDAAHQHALKVEALRTELNSTQQAMQRIESQIEQLQTRRDDIAQQIEQGIAPLQNMEAELAQVLEQRQAVEATLGQARNAMQEIEHAMQQDTTASGEADRKSQDIRGQLEQLRMDYQGVHVRLQTLQEQIDETGFTLEALYESLTEDASVTAWEENVTKLENRIQRLGAINLAAIEEFKERSERKEYLDKQMSDLEEALTTLENAIHKIDKETRTRFKETYDKVNAGFKSMFPRLFGGGHAYMELTEDDLLTTGITVMARPPGKRNGTIHLLSGGEKALTAAALVFSIFELNPAPFCLLDEVDAPLDDANVTRFCDLVREMSDRIQFIFITHNKVTMELANQLMGVTMNEPGVSRLVAVDVDEAASMVAS